MAQALHRSHPPLRAGSTFFKNAKKKNVNVAVAVPCRRCRRQVLRVCLSVFPRQQFAIKSVKPQLGQTESARYCLVGRTCSCAHHSSLQSLSKLDRCINIRFWCHLEANDVAINFFIGQCKACSSKKTTYIKRFRVSAPLKRRSYSAGK